MVIKEKKILGIIREIRIALENDTLPLSAFPMEEVIHLIDSTLGAQFWKKTGKVHQDSFAQLPETYRAILQRCVDKKDVQGCVQNLELLELQYKCMYAALSEEEKENYAKKYKVMVSSIGSAYSSLQYWKHQCQMETYEKKDTLWEKGKGVVYTCILDSVMKLQQPEYINVFWDYICFTDQAEKWGTKDGVWEYRRIEPREGHDKDALYYTCKIKPHEVLPEYDYSIWVSPKLQIVGELEQFCKIYGQNVSFLGFPSYWQDDIYDLMYTTLHDDDVNIAIRKKKLQYQKEGYPTHYGVLNSSVMVRNHRDEKIKATMECWWEEAGQCKQLRESGFHYAAWKNQLEFAVCDLFVELNPYFKNKEINLEVKVAE